MDHEGGRDLDDDRRRERIRLRGQPSTRHDSNQLPKSTSLLATERDKRIQHRADARTREKVDRLADEAPQSSGGRRHLEVLQAVPTLARLDIY